MTGTDVVTTRDRRLSRPAVGLLAVLIVLACSGVGTAQGWNLSFEETFNGLPSPRPLPWYWTWEVEDHPSFNSFCTDSFFPGEWPTDGAWSAVLCSRTGSTFSLGDYQNFRQWFDLTGVSHIAFDVALTASTGVFEHFEASFLIDGVLVWSANAEGIYYDQQVSTAGLSTEEPHPYHLIELRLTAVEVGSFDAEYAALWDNIRLLEGSLSLPSLSAVIDLDPGTLNLASNGRWVTCYIELEEDGAVALIDGGTVMLDGIPAEVQEHGWATRWANEDNITDHDGDGIPERMVKFSREAVQAMIQPGETEITVTVMGYLVDGQTPFLGEATLRVVEKNSKKK